MSRNYRKGIPEFVICSEELRQKIEFCKVEQVG